MIVSVLQILAGNDTKHHADCDTSVAQEVYRKLLWELITWSKPGAGYNFFPKIWEMEIVL